MEDKIRKTICCFLEDILLFADSDKIIKGKITLAIVYIKNVEFEKIRSYYKENLLKFQMHFENRSDEHILKLLGDYVTQDIIDFFEVRWFPEDDEDESAFLEDEKENIWKYADTIIEIATQIEENKK